MWGVVGNEKLARSLWYETWIIEAHETKMSLGNIYLWLILIIYTPRSPRSYLGIVIWFCVRFVKHLGGGEFTWRKARFSWNDSWLKISSKQKRNIAPLLFETWKVHQQLLLLSRGSDRINLESNLSGIRICRIYFFFEMALLKVCVCVCLCWLNLQITFPVFLFVGGHHKCFFYTCNFQLLLIPLN